VSVVLGILLASEVARLGEDGAGLGNLSVLWKHCLAASEVFSGIGRSPSPLSSSIFSGDAETAGRNSLVEAQINSSVLTVFVLQKQ
jgi:hypothetical protein